MKRIVDIIGALVGLILLSPVIAILWVLIRRNLGTPVLFRQTRPGKDGVPFEILIASALLRWGPSCAARRWMNCQSCGMC